MTQLLKLRPRLFILFPSSFRILSNALLHKGVRECMPEKLANNILNGLEELG